MWMHKLVRFTHLDRLAKGIGINEKYAPLLYAIIAIVIMYAVTNSYELVTFGWADLVLRPISALFIISVVTLGILGMIHLHRIYYDTLGYLFNNRRIARESKDELSVMIPAWAKKVLLGIWLLIAFLFSLSQWWAIKENPNLIGSRTLNQEFSGGYPVGIGVAIFYMAVISPGAADLFTIFIGVLRLPTRIAKQISGRLDLLDPARCGGLRPIGVLAVQSSIVYFSAITMINVLFMMGGGLPLGWILVFGIGWMIGICLFIIPLLNVHYYMKREKEKYLTKIIHDIKKARRKRSKTISGKMTTIEYRLHLMELHLEYESAEKLQEYPFDTKILRDVVFAALLPLIVEVIYTFLKPIFGNG